MPETEILLQELVDLKKKEMKRAQTDRWLKFLFGTLPVFILVIITIVSTWMLVGSIEETLKQFPGMFDGINLGFGS
jgi:hypothetical protein